MPRRRHQQAGAPVRHRPCQVCQSRKPPIFPYLVVVHEEPEMDHISRLKRQFRHDLIANLATLRSIEAMSPPPERAVELMAHIAGSQSVWQSRIGIEAMPPLPVWPTLSLANCRPLLETLA